MIKKLFGYAILLALFSIVFFARATMFGFLIASIIWSVAGVATFLVVLAVRWITD